MFWDCGGAIRRTLAPCYLHLNIRGVLQMPHAKLNNISVICISGINSQNGGLWLVKSQNGGLWLASAHLSPSSLPARCRWSRSRWRCPLSPAAPRWCWPPAPPSGAGETWRAAAALPCPELWTCTSNVINYLNYSISGIRYSYLFIF